MITTSTFSPAAKAYVEGLTTRIALIDGVQLADLMIGAGLVLTRESKQ